MATPRSSDRVLALLGEIVDADGEQSLSALSGAVGLAPSTTTRQLASLEAVGLVRRGPAGGWVAGPTLVRWAHRVVGAHPLPRLAEPVLADLAAATGESCYLAIVHDAAQATYVAAAEGTHHLRHAGWRGRLVPRPDTAVGAALAGEPSVRRDGVEEGVTAVTAPVCDARAEPVAAVCLLGPTFRLRDAALDAARERVATAAEQLSALVGDPGTG